MSNLFKKLSQKAFEEDRSMQERLFILLTITAVVGSAIALVGDIILGENIVEIVTLGITVATVPFITYFSIHMKKMKIATIFIVLTLVFIILPIVFLFGGGVDGGCLPWIIFSYLYIGLVLSGGWRNVMLAILTVLSCAAYVIDYLYPDLTIKHSTGMRFIDTCISLVVVGIVIYVMVWFQIRLFKEENRKAREEAERAEELTRSQNRFFSSMSHEIRTPINSILGLNEVILRQEDASDEIIKDATNIQGAGKMLLVLINDILDFSKIEAGSMDIVPVDYKVGDMISEIVNMIWLRASEKGLAFNVDIDPNVPSVLFGDEIRIRQIIINLLNNAVKYTNEGSVSLHVESEKVGDNHVLLLISVADTGIGIKSEVIPHLFDAFKRADQAKNRYIEGTGLGLSIVKQLVDLMGGEVSVNSVYGQGSTFTVSVLQGVSDSSVMGNISITNFGDRVGRNKYEHLFTAPEAKVLIVDDNEMNLEVEKKLLKDTQVTVHTALSGREALARTLEDHYDVILMDHLMPEMDGIECLEKIRNQTGGLNADIPVIVLTANAGSKNKELYTSSGFDGYLLKPVAGRQLEETLMKYISSEKLIISESTQMNADEMNTAKGYRRRIPVAFATSSLSDIPENMVKTLGITIIPWEIITDEGVFRDNVEMSADEVVRYMDSGKNATSDHPEIEEYVETFGKMLRKAHHVIYIALTSSMSEDYERASVAAKSFENVTVINSESMSSAMGMMVLAGCRMARQNVAVEKIVAELENMKKRLHTGFILGTTDYMARKNLVSKRVNKLTNSLELRPAIRYKDDKYSIRGIWRGSRRHCYAKYIKKCLPRRGNPDLDLLFVTYVAVPEEDIEWVEKQIRRRSNFEHIIFQRASAAVSSNCGPGTLGLLYFEKGERSYNLSSLLPKESEGGEGQATPGVPGYMMTGAERESEGEEADVAGNSNGNTGRKIDGGADKTGKDTGTDAKESGILGLSIEGIDVETAIKNSGSEDAFKTVLEIFYRSIPEKSAQIENYFEAENWEDYTIKVHALKSSAKLIGATELSEEAQKLEDAGKEKDSGYILENHKPMMEKYLGYEEILKDIFDAKEDGADKPEADEGLMKSVYETLREAAEAMDCDALEETFNEMAEYKIPENEAEIFESLRKCAEKLDYEGIISLLAKK